MRVDELPLSPGERVLAFEECTSSARTRRLVRACAAGLSAAALLGVVGLVLPGDARLVVLCAAAVALVGAIPLGWFAFVRSMEDPTLRAVTTDRALLVTRSGDLHELPLSRISAVRPLTASGQPTDGWASAARLSLDGRDGEHFEMQHASLSELGSQIEQAVAARSGGPAAA